MIQIPLVNGRSMPALGLGTWDLRGNECFSTICEALKIGYRHIDTAEMYGNEAEIGKALKISDVPRAELFITTKVWTNHHKAKDFKKAAEDSLERLGLTEVDLLLVHWPNPAVPLFETLGALCQLNKDGKALAIGVSNFSSSLLQEAITLASVPIACDQVPYSIPENQDELLKFTHPQKISVCAYTPLGRGSFLKHPKLAEVGRKYAKSPAQVALRWLVQQEGVAAIPKATGEKHLKENLAVFDFELDSEDLRALEILRNS